MFIPLHDANRLRHISRPYVTYALIAVTVMAFLASGGFDEYAVQRAAIEFGFIPALIRDGLAASPQSVPEAATTLTYAFLHADWLHLGGNMLFLWVFGDNVEDALGHLRTVIFYLACSVAGALAFALGQPESTVPLIGASGAVAGIIGAYLILHPRVKLWVLAFGRIPLRLSAMWVLGFWLLLQLLNAAIADPESGVAFSTHLGGFAAGAVLVVLLRRRGVPLFDAGVT